MIPTGKCDRAVFKGIGSREINLSGVHTSRITPLNPPLERGETGKSCSLPFARGGLGWGKYAVRKQYDLVKKTR
jgi:hypothetical protein